MSNKLPIKTNRPAHTDAPLGGWAGSWPQANGDGGGMSLAQIVDASESRAEMRRRRGNEEKIKHVLGEDPSAAKAINKLGIDEVTYEEIVAEIEEEKEEEERAALLNIDIRDKRNSKKALEVLGHDPSFKKAARRFGTTAQSAEEASREIRNILHTEEVERAREQAVRAEWKDKKSTRKAQAMLGFDPSHHKLSQTLGVDPGDVDKIVNAELTRVELAALQAQRARTHVGRRRGLSKAEELLDIDFSAAKAALHLGVDASVVESEVERLRAEVAMGAIMRARKANSWKDKKHTAKAQQRLGVDPSSHKLAAILGVPNDIVDNEINAIQQEKEMEAISVQRYRETWRDKRHTRKAQEVLGIDPSVEKLRKMYGDELATAASQEDLSSKPRTFLGVPHAMVIGAVPVIVGLLFYSFITPSSALLL